MVRVRFAPSPTGPFHVGGARTALWNWLFARQRSGQLVLRIEDTDDERNEDQWVGDIHAALQWLGLDWDSETRQSDNTTLQVETALRLFDQGLAYYCDCTPDAVAARKPPGAPPGYDDFCRERGLAAGPGRALRFRIRDGQTIIDDVVRGRVEFENDKLGGDFVILRGNGRPIFYLANTVDDIDQSITHVLRSEEHLPNAPKNQLLWEAIGGAAPPTWAHLPLLVNEQRKKLSKRRDRVYLGSYRDQGFLVEAMRNYLCLLGWAPGGDREFLTLDDMLSLFRLEDVNSSPAFFDVKKLTAFNEHYLRSMDTAEFTRAAAPFLAAGPWSSDHFDVATFEKLVPVVQQRARTLADVPRLVDFIFLDAPDIEEAAWAKEVAGRPFAGPVLESAAVAYRTVVWEAGALHETTASLASEHDLALGKAQAPIRVAVTGRTVGPPLFESLEVLGRDRTVQRIEAALERLRLQ